MALKERNMRIKKKKSDKRYFRIRMCAALLLFASCVALYSCGGEDDPRATSPSGDPSTSAQKTAAVTSSGAYVSGTEQTIGTLPYSETVTDITKTDAQTTSTEKSVQTKASSTKDAAPTATQKTEPTGTQQNTSRNKYSDLPIYSPPVTDTVTFSKDKLKIYNSDFRFSSSLQTEYENLVKNYALSFTFTLRDLETEAVVSHNDEQKYRSASSIKGPYGLYAGKVFDAGKASLSTVVEYTPQFYMENGSGPIRKNGQFGDKFTAKRLEYLMIHESDNSAYFMLSSITGGKDGLNDMVRDLGCDKIIVDSTYWGKLTSREMGLIWREIYYYGQSGTESGTRVYGLFEKAKFNDLQSYMGYKVVHKSGWGNVTFNDAGIVYYKDRHFVASVVVERVDVYDEAVAKGQFKKVCKFLVKVMKEYKAYAESHKDPEPTQKVTQTTAAPVVTTVTTEKPEPVTTKATEPATTKAPVVTTEAPATSTEAPTTTKAATTTTEAPPPATSTTAAQPSDTTEAA